MKMSLREMTCRGFWLALCELRGSRVRYILMSKVLEKFELTVGTLGEDGGAKGLHNLLDGDILVGELISGRARFVLVGLLGWQCRY